MNNNENELLQKQLGNVIKAFVSLTGMSFDEISLGADLNSSTIRKVMDGESSNLHSTFRVINAVGQLLADRQTNHYKHFVNTIHLISTDRLFINTYNDRYSSVSPDLIAALSTPPFWGENAPTIAHPIAAYRKLFDKMSGS